MSARAHLIMMGLRGSGKTTLGRALAGELGRPFVDLDDETARELGGANAGSALRVNGEGAFRLAEARALERVIASDPRVIALGGGTPTAPGAAGLLAEAQRLARASLVYLRASAPTLRARLASSGVDRPALLGSDPLGEIEALLERRDPLYRRLANAVIDVDGLDHELAMGALRDWAAAADPG